MDDFQEIGDPIDKLYSTLKKKGYYTKSIGEFKQKYSSPESIDKLYEVVNRDGLYTKTKDDFYKQYYPTTVTTTPKKKDDTQQAIIGLSKIFPSTVKNLLTGAAKSESATPSTLTGEDSFRPEQAEIDPNDPVKSYLQPDRDFLKQIREQRRTVESVGQNQVEKMSISNMVNAAKQKEREVIQSVFPTGKDAQNYLSQVIGVQDIDNVEPETIEKLTNPRNETQALAKDKYYKLRAVKDDIKTSNTFEQLALKQAARNGGVLKKQIDYLGGSLPKNMKGDLILQLLNNPDLYEAAEDNPKLRAEIDEQTYALPERYPATALKHIAQLVSNVREQKGIGNGILNVPSVATTTEIVNELVNSGALPENYLQFYNKKGVDKLVTSNLRTPGFIENALQSADRSLMNIGKTGAELTGIRSLYKDTDDQTFDALAEQYQQVGFKPKGILHEISTSGGDLVGQVLPLMAGGSALRASKLLQSDFATNALMTGLQTYGYNLENARTQLPGESAEKQTGLALANTGVEMSLSNVFNDMKFARSLTKKAAPEIRQIIDNFSNKSISSAAAKTQLNEVFDKLLTAGKSTVKTSVSNANEEAATELLQNTNNKLFGGEQLSDSENLNRAFKVWKTSFYGGLPLGGGGGIVKAMNDPAAGAIVYEVASNPEEYKKIINDFASIDEETEQLKDERIKNIDYASQVLSELDKRGLPEDKKAKYLVRSLNEKIIKEEAAQIGDPLLKKDSEKKLAELEISKKALLDPEMSNTKIVQEFFDNELLGKSSLETLSVRDEDGKPTNKFDPSKVGEYLKEAAQRLNNLDSDWQPNKAGDSSKAAKESYPEAIAEIANERWKKEIEAAQQKLDLETGIGEPEQISQPIELSVDTQQGLPDDKVDIRQRYLDDFNLVEDSSFDWRVKSELSTKDRKKAVQDIKEGKNTAAARKLEQEIAETIERGTVIINRGRGNNATTVEIPIDEWFSLDTNEQNAVESIDDFTASIINENEITLENIDNLKNLFNGFPYTEQDFKTIKSYLSGQSESNVENKPTPEASQTQPTPTQEAVGELPPIDTSPTSKGPYVERPGTELSFRGLQNVANEFSLPDVKSRNTKSDIQLRQEARETVDGWAEKGEYAKNVEGLVEKADNGDVLTDKERVILEGHLANVSQEARDIRESKGILSPEYEQKLAELKRLKDAGEKTRSEAGAALRIPTFNSRPKTIEDAMILEKDSLGVDVLTDAQKETVAKEFTEIETLQKAYDEKIQALQDENARLRAEQEVKNVASKTKRQKKDFVKERQEIFANIKDKLKKARQDTTVTVVPYAKELIAISPDVAKLVKNLVEQGVTELGEIVKTIHDTLKDEIEGVTEKDVRDIIAGEYTPKKKTRNELAATLVDLRTEASLLNKLDNLLSGQEPTTERKKIERNKAITELRQKIKESDVTKLKTRKEKIRSDIAKVEEQIKRGDFSPPEKKQPIKLDKEGLELRDKLNKLKQNRDVRMLLQQRKNESGREKAFRLTAEVANIPRTLMTIGDFSGLLRQNIFFSAGHPLMTSKALPGMFKSFTSQKVYDRWFADLKESPRYQIIKDSKLSIADSLSHDLSEREEAFMSSLPEKIPIVGSGINIKGVKVPGLNIVKGSERSYTMLLNKMRVDVFNYFVDSLEKRGITYENSPKVYKSVAEYVNNATGRSDFGKTLNRIAPILNAAFFSPRLMASRVNMLTYWAQPRFWKTLPREVRIDYFRNWISLLALGGTVLALAKAGGADVEDDPRSSDFGKIKSGDTRWDIWGGAQPYVRVLSQIISGQRKSTKSGKIYDLSGDDIFGEDRMGVGMGFLRNKLAPVPGAAVDLLSGRTSIGDKIMYQWGDAGDKEISIDQYIKQRLLPMTITGTEEALKDQGTKALLTVTVPSIFGVGTQTYDSSPTKNNMKSRPKMPKKPEKQQ